MSLGRSALTRTAIRALTFLLANWIGSALAETPDFAYWEIDSVGNGRVAIGIFAADSALATIWLR